jgi:hypothetical protein
VSHLGDAASWYWPGRTCSYESFARRRVGPSEPGRPRPAEHVLGSCPSRPLSTEPEEARGRARTDPAQVKMYSTGPNRKG